MLRNIILGAGVFAALFAILIFSGKLPIGKKETKPVGEVVVWGTISETSIAQILQTYNPQAKTYRVSYREFREETFVSTLVEALANGKGPDVIIAPHQIILSQAARLYTYPIASFSEKAYRDMYVDAGSIFFTPSGPIALPITVDPLVLFYNRRIFSQKGIVTPPQYWDEITTLVEILNQRNDKGRFDLSGIALGSPLTPYAKDILMAIVAQVGQIPVLKQLNPDGSAALTVTANNTVVKGGDVYPLASAVRFFTQFADPNKVTYSWDDFSGQAADQFVAEKLAMYIGYASEFARLKSQNQRADFDMTYFPQTRTYNTFSTGVRMYGIATLKTTKNPYAALTVETDFAGAGVAPAIAAQIGAVPALRAYAKTTGLNEVLAKSMLVATPWYDSYSNQSTALFTTTISDVVNGRSGPNEGVQALIGRLQDLYMPR